MPAQKKKSKGIMHKIKKTISPKKKTPVVVEKIKVVEKVVEKLVQSEQDVETAYKRGFLGGVACCIVLIAVALQLR